MSLMVFLIGPSGSGKTTHAKWLCAELQRQQHACIHLQPGQLLRDERELGTALGDFIKFNWNHASLSDLSVNMMQRKMRGLDVSADVVVDGHPRNIEEARTLGDLSQTRSVCVIALVNCDTEAWQRSLERQRAGDDTVQSLEIRRETFRKQREPIADFLRACKVYHEVDTCTTISTEENVRAAIIRCVAAVRTSPCHILPTQLHVDNHTVDPIERACAIQYSLYMIQSQQPEKGTPRKWKHFPGRQAVSLTHKNLHFLSSHKPYVVSIKADGIRMLLVTIGDRLYSITRALHVHLVLQHECVRELQMSLLDCEWILEKTTFIILDIPYCYNKPRGHMPLLERMQVADRVALLLNFPEFRFFPQKYFIVKHVDMVPIDRLPFTHDGFIFTPDSTPYCEGTDRYLLKWKEAACNTVDFLYRDGKIWMQNGKTCDVFADLYNPANTPLQHGDIIECKFNRQRQWELVRIRYDKDRPNSRDVVLDICANLRKPVKWTQLVGVAILQARS